MTLKPQKGFRKIQCFLKKRNERKMKNKKIEGVYIMLQSVNFFLKTRLKIGFFVNNHYLHGEPKKVAHVQKM